MPGVSTLQKFNVFNSYNTVVKEVLLLYSHFMDTETKAQRGEFTCPRSHSSKKVSLPPPPIYTVCKGRQRFLVCDVDPETLGPNNPERRCQSRPN